MGASDSSLHGEGFCNYSNITAMVIADTPGKDLNSTKCTSRVHMYRHPQTLPSRHAPVRRLVKGRVNCPRKSLLEVKSWSSTMKRTRARSGTWTVKLKVQSHRGLNPGTRKEHMSYSMRFDLLALHHAYAVSASQP